MQAKVFLTKTRIVTDSEKITASSIYLPSQKFYNTIHIYQNLQNLL
jgi:hypothetical protein